MTPLLGPIRCLALLALIAPLTLRADAPRQVSGELQQEIARIFPPAPDADAERHALERIATGGGLADVTVRTLTGPDASGLEPIFRAPGIRTSLHELTATGDELGVVMTLVRMRYLPRVGAVESAEIVPEGERSARLVARVAFPALDPTAISSDDLLELANRIHRHPAWESTLDGLAAASDGLPVGVTRVRFGSGASPGMELEALAVGAATPEAFRHALIGAGIEDATVRSAARGRCVALSATGRIPTLEDDELETSERLAATKLFLSESEAPCALPAATAPVRVEATGTAGERTATLRTSSATNDDLLFLLEAAFGRTTAGPGGGARAFELDLRAVALDEALGALSRAGAPFSRFGEAVLGPGAAPAREPDPPYTGEPISAAFHCADVTELLALFGRITGLELRPDPDVRGCVDLYATDRPWDEALDAIFAAAGLAHRVEGTTVLVSKPAGSANTEAEAPRSTSTDPRWHPELERLSVEDFRLFAVLETGSSRRAFAHGPLGGRYELVPGSQLADARVESIDAHGVALSSASRALRLDLP